MRMLLVLALVVGCGSHATKHAPANVGDANAQPARTLSITGIKPDKGDAEGATFVVIKGTDFIADGARNVKVYFGTRQATIIRFASDTELVVQAPAGTRGETVDVTVLLEPGGELKLPHAFTFVVKQGDVEITP